MLNLLGSASVSVVVRGGELLRSWDQSLQQAVADEMKAIGIDLRLNQRELFKPHTCSAHCTRARKLNTSFSAPRTRRINTHTHPYTYMESSLQQAVAVRNESQLVLTSRLNQRICLHTTYMLSHPFARRET